MPTLLSARTSETKREMQVGATFPVPAKTLRSKVNLHPGKVFLLQSGGRGCENLEFKWKCCKHSLAWPWLLDLKANMLNMKTRHENEMVPAGKRPAPLPHLIPLSSFRSTMFCVPIRKFHRQKAVAKSSPAHAGDAATKPLSERTTQVRHE